MNKPIEETKVQIFPWENHLKALHVATDFNEEGTMLEILDALFGNLHMAIEQRHAYELARTIEGMMLQDEDDRLEPTIGLLKDIIQDIRVPGCEITQENATRLRATFSKSKI